MKLTELISKSNGILLNEIEKDIDFNHIVTDTRILKKNDIFIALTGPNYDGHDYLEEAVEKGASAVFVEQEIKPLSIPVIQVNDTYQCLFDLARVYLEQYPVFVIAVTGSVGKTTTKELIAKILEKKYHVLKSEGNKNNRIGIPQTIFQLNSNIDCLVLELGMNHFHEIENLSTLISPNIAVITNIGSAHIGYLGSKKNILKAKMEILAGMKAGILVLNGHDKLLQKIKKISCGNVEHVSTMSGNIKIELLEQTVFGSKLFLSNGIEQATLFFQIPGEAVLEDLALSLQIGEYLEIPFYKMIEALEEYRPMKQRMKVEQLSSGNILINDSYNSSYESLQMNLELLKKGQEHKIFILGDILELGKKSKKMHKKIGRELKRIPNLEVYFIGKEMKYAYQTYHMGKHFNNVAEWILYWKNQNMETLHSIILLKGSRKMRLEECIPFLK